MEKESTTAFIPSAASPSKIGLHGEWLSVGRRYTLWLPPEHRGKKFAIHDNKLYVANSTSGLSRFRVKGEVSMEGEGGCICARVVAGPRVSKAVYPKSEQG